MSLDAWPYRNVSPERQADLARFGSFAALLEAAAQEAECRFVRWEDGEGAVPPQFYRPVFSVRLPATGDALFNGPHGLRAAYYANPAEGAEATRALLRGLEGKLLDALPAPVKPGQDRGCAELSLRAPGAKIWSEANPEGIDPDGPGPQLANERWRAAAIAESAGFSKCDARRGIDASPIEILDVKGGWRSAIGKTITTPDKQPHRRAKDIHEKGSS
ncbi:hypothetical protein QTH97_22870 [Variovorax sp. J22R24]|uniref:hypothetical protein n=1 Tax=Variovorax gracilis TaxID=3053502 RepID=UPI0025752AC5|nr:hypothetical protein [Variovorax sp. J22R24]MDM0107807.1 hypothetical protein [Variovorax sp. J22R24]